MPRPVLVLVLSLVAVLGGCSGSSVPGSWPQANGDLAGARAAEGSLITTRNAAELRVRWRFALRAKPGFTSTPVADADTIYLQDARSDVFALDRATGALRWIHRDNTSKDRSNGLAVDSGRVYDATHDAIVALASKNGRELWQRRWRATSRLRSGTGSCSPARRARCMRSMRTQGGSAGASARATPTPCRSTATAVSTRARHERLLVLDAKTGKLLWTAERDDDFEATPVLASIRDADLVFGAGTAGRIIAWDSSTQKRRWTTRAGCSGSLETPIAYARARLFVPVAAHCGRLVTINARTGAILGSTSLTRPRSAVQRSRTTSSSQRLSPATCTAFRRRTGICSGPRRCAQA